MSVTPRLGMPELEAGQDISESVANEITRYLEAVASRVVVDKDRTTPAGTEGDGDCFIVPASPTGAWAGKAGNIAIKVSTAWVFIAPFAGLTFFVQDEAVNYRYSGGAWTAVAGGGTAASLDYDTDGTLAANSDSKIATQKAVKAAIAAAVAGLSWKQAVRVATTANGTLASAYENGDTVDGVTLATGDRILLKNQTTGSENGIFTVNASGAPTRATDADSGAELVNASCYVSEGTTNADTQWTCSTNAPITVGSTGLTWTQFTSGSSYTDEMARDAIGAALTNLGLAVVTPNDGADTITINVPAAAASDINTGTDTTKAVTADALAGSNTGKRVVQIAVTDPAGSALATGDGQAYFRVPSALNGMNLVEVAATVITVSSSGLPTIQIANVTDGVDMLSTKLTIDASETDSSTALTAAVIDTAHDDIATADVLRIDVDVAGTGAKGLIVTLTFQLP